MDALVPIFVAVLLAEMGGKTQTLARAHGLGGKMAQGLAALSLASIINYALAAAASIFIAPLLPAEAKELLFAVALLLTGLHMFASVRNNPILLDKGGVGTSLMRFAKSQLGDDAQFLVFGLAVKTGSPILAASGALAAVLVASLVPMAMAKDWPEKAIKWVRRLCALILTVVGFTMGVSAMGLINAT